MSLPDPAIWAGMLAHLRKHHPQRCRHWFESIDAADDSGGVLQLRVPDPVHRRYLQRECASIFTEAAQAVTGRLLVVRFVEHPVIVHNGATKAAPTGSNGHAAPTPSYHDDMVLNPDYTFDHFIVGPSNRLAHAAAIAVAQQPGRAYNPYFIHGGVGLGKTHLLQAICHVLLADNPGVSIYYVSCEAFASQFHEAVQAGQMAEFRHRFRHVDVLVVDDIHFLARQDQTQEEFFHTFNTLHQAGKQLVLSSDAPPHEIPDLKDRLVSRFKSGLVARIDPPCYETRIAILRKKAALRDLPLPEDVATYLAQVTESNIRELEGALTQVQAMSMALGDPITLDLATQAVGDHRETPQVAVSIQDIMAMVSRQFAVKAIDLLSKRRHQSVALPRQVAMYLARRHTNHSLQEIGGYFGGRDHTTVMHAVGKIEQMREQNEPFARVLTSLEREISLRP